LLDSILFGRPAEKQVVVQRLHGLVLPGTEQQAPHGDDGIVQALLSWNSIWKLFLRSRVISVPLFVRLWSVSTPLSRPGWDNCVRICSSVPRAFSESTFLMLRSASVRLTPPSTPIRSA
jgi:hypothetical protein